MAKTKTNRGSIPRRAKDFSLLPDVHIGSGGHNVRAALSVETKRPEHIPDPSPPTDERLGMRGQLLPLLRVPPRCGAQLVKLRERFWAVSKSGRLNAQFQYVLDISDLPLPKEVTLLGTNSCSSQFHSRHCGRI